MDEVSLLTDGPCAQQGREKLASNTWDLKRTGSLHDLRTQAPSRLLPCCPSSLMHESAA
jgi:hypothetical protein